MPGRLSFDRVAAIYDETRSLAPRAMARVLAALVDELHGKRVLEIGVGTGRYAVPLQKSGIRVIGVDISRKMVEIGLAKGLRDVVFADATLDELDRRTYSSQWDVPDEIHRKAMEPLRAKWRGKEIQWSYTLEVTFWRSERLLEIATSQRP